VTRSHRNTYVGGSLLTQEMQEEFHHSCMTSGKHASNTVASCCLANPNVIQQLNEIAMMELNECVPGPAKTISDTLPRSTTLEKHE
jgi:hypothetical protein